MTKMKKFFLKAAGISLAKAAGISLAFVLAFAMAFAACDTGTSSSRTPTVPGGDGDYEAPPVSRIFKSDANGTVELTITEILSASTQTADTQTVDSRTVDSRTAFSIAAPTSGERFYYAIRVKGYSTPVSSGTVTAGEPVWTFTPVAGSVFTMTATGSGASLAFTAGTKITAYDGSVVEIPALSVTGSSKDSGPSGIPSGPSAAQQAATALAAKLGSKATVTGDGTVVTLTASVALGEGDELEIPNGVTLAVAGKELTVGRGATLTVAADGIIDLGTTGTIAGTGTIDNDGTIETKNTAGFAALVAIPNTGTGQVLLEAPASVSAPLTLGTNLEIDGSGSITFTGPNTTAFSGGKTVTISGTGTLDLGATVETLGATIINNGTEADAVKTSTVTGSVLKTILDNVTGNITASGANISLPASGATTTVKTGTTLTVSGSLKVPTGAGLTLTDASSKVAVTGTLNLAELASPANNDAVDLKGTIEVAKDGIFLGPVPEASGQTPEINWNSGSGGIVFNKGSKGYFGTVSGDYYIGPDNESPHYKWDATNPGTVTLKGTELILDGYLTSAKANYIADKATINGTLTVKAGLTLAASAELVVADGAKVVVNGDGGVLDLAALFTSGPGDTDTASGTVTLNGDIVIAKDGILNISQGNNSALPPEIDWTKGGSVTIANGGKVTLASAVTYIGTSGDSNLIYQWTDDYATGNVAAQNVTLNGDNGITMNGNITANTFPGGETTNYLSGKNTISANYTLTVGDASELKVGSGTGNELIVEGTVLLASTKFLSIYPDAKLTVAATGTITASSAVYIHAYDATLVGGGNPVVKVKSTGSDANNWVLTKTDGDNATAVPAINNIILGKLKFATLPANTAVNVAGTQETTGVKGTLTAGTDTAITFYVQ